MPERKVSVTNKHNERLVGIETTPTIKKNKYPAIILIHGFGSGKHEFKGMFDLLAQQIVTEEFLVYRFDFSGRGESEGDYSETNLSKLKEDLGTILSFVRQQPVVDTQRIGLVGFSLGTATIVALHPTVQAIVLLGSVAHPKEILIQLFGEGYNPKGISIRKAADGEVVKIKPQFWKEFDKYDLIKCIQKISAPILFVHGSNDDKVPLSEMEAYFKHAPGPKEKVIIKGADHHLNPHQEKMGKVVASWLKKNI